VPFLMFYSNLIKKYLIFTTTSEAAVFFLALYPIVNSRECLHWAIILGIAQ